MENYYLDWSELTKKVYITNGKKKVDVTKWYEQIVLQREGKKAKAILTAAKNKVAIEKGYPSWEEMENFIIDHNNPVVVAQLLVSAMEEVFNKNEPCG